MLLTVEFLFVLHPDGDTGITFFGTTFSPGFGRVVLLRTPLDTCACMCGALRKRSLQSTSRRAVAAITVVMTYIVLVAFH